jgi:hypothetical protein
VQNLPFVVRAKYPDGKLFFEYLSFEKSAHECFVSLKKRCFVDVEMVKVSDA